MGRYKAVAASRSKVVRRQNRIPMLGERIVTQEKREQKGRSRHSSDGGYCLDCWLFGIDLLRSISDTVDSAKPKISDVEVCGPIPDDHDEANPLRSATCASLSCRSMSWSVCDSERCSALGGWARSQGWLTMVDTCGCVIDDLTTSLRQAGK